MTSKYEEIKQLISKAQEPFTGTSAHMELGFYAPILLKALELASRKIWSHDDDCPCCNNPGYWIEQASKDAKPE